MITKPTISSSSLLLKFLCIRQVTEEMEKVFFCFCKWKCFSWPDFFVDVYFFWFFFFWENKKIEKIFCYCSFFCGFCTITSIVVVHSGGKMRKKYTFTFNRKIWVKFIEFENIKGIVCQKRDLNSLTHKRVWNEISIAFKTIWNLTYN